MHRHLHREIGWEVALGRRESCHKLSARILSIAQVPPHTSSRAQGVTECFAQQ